MKRSFSTIDVVGQWCVPGRTDDNVVAGDAGTWMLLCENERDAVVASVHAAQAGRLRPWMTYGIAAPPEVLKASMEVDGVMLRCRGALTLIPVRFGDRWMAAERQGTDEARGAAMVEIVQLAADNQRTSKRFLKKLHRTLRGINGVWDAEAGLMIVFDAAGLQFSRPENVKKLSTRDRLADRDRMPARTDTAVRG